MIQTITPDLTPARLRKLMLRLAELTPGQAYTVTLIIPDETTEPMHVVTPLGKLENHRRQVQQKVLE